MRKQVLWAATAMAVVAMAAGSANAATFQNGSFELGSFVPNTPQGDESLAHGSTDITGWTVVGSGDLGWEPIVNPFTETPSDGNFHLDLTGYHDSSPYSGVAQTFDTLAGHTYRLTFDVGTSARYNGSGGATVQAFIDGNSLYSFHNGGVDPVDNQHSWWETGSFNFTTGASSTTLALIGQTGGAFIGLDNVTLTDLTRDAGPGGVPEPASWALMLVGFGGLGAVLRRRPRAALAV